MTEGRGKETQLNPCRLDFIAHRSEWWLRYVEVFLTVSCGVAQAAAAGLAMVVAVLSVAVTMQLAPPLTTPTSLLVPPLPHSTR